MTATHPQMRPDQAMSMIEALCINPMEQGRMPIPVMIWGQPGVGKSSIIKQLGEKHNRPVIDIRLLLKDPTDLAGLPYFDVNQGELKVANPVGFPDEKNPEHAHLLNAIIILDELSSAPKAVQSAALQLILDRKVGDYTLPKDVIMIHKASLGARLLHVYFMSTEEFSSRLYKVVFSQLCYACTSLLYIILSL